MADDDHDEDRNGLDPFDFALWFPETSAFDDLRGDLHSLVDGATPNPADIETALSGLSLPDGSDLAVDTEVVPNANLRAAEVDRVVDAGGEAVEIAVEGTGEAGKVLIDTGEEVVEVAVESGGEAAVEATGELIAAALEGL